MHWEAGPYQSPELSIEALNRLGISLPAMPTSVPSTPFPLSLPYLGAFDQISEKQLQILTEAPITEQLNILAGSWYFVGHLHRGVKLLQFSISVPKFETDYMVFFISTDKLWLSLGLLSTRSHTSNRICRGICGRPLCMCLVNMIIFPSNSYLAAGSWSSIGGQISDSVYFVVTLDVAVLKRQN